LRRSPVETRREGEAAMRASGMCGVDLRGREQRPQEGIVAKEC
jgi:hypothetical protein